jgi:hypothetical protein
LLSSLREEPAKFNGWLMVEILDFLTARVGEQFQLMGVSPCPKNQGPHARLSVLSNSGQLQPTGGRRTPLTSLRSFDQWSPWRKN